LDFPVFPHTKPRLREAPQEPPADFPVKAHLMGEVEFYGKVTGKKKAFSNIFFP
jgi:hypothetical protein